MKRNVLIFGYTSFSDNEIFYWNNLAISLRDNNYELFVFGNCKLKEEVYFNGFKFIEKAEDEKDIDFKNFNFKNYNISRYLERENLWYGSSNLKKKTKGIKTKIVKYKKLLDQLNPCLTILGNGEHANELIFKDILINNKLPYFFFERGCLPNSWHFDYFGITANTKIAKSNINDLKIQENSIENFNLYKDYYLSNKKSWWHQPITNNIDLRLKLNIPKDKKIILFLNQLDNDTSNFLYSPLYENNIQAFKWLCDKLNKHSNKFYIIIKKHPWFNLDKTSFVESMTINNLEGEWVDDVNIFDCISQSDYVCSVNSTANFESLLFNKPVLQLGKSILSNKNICYEINSINDEIVITEWLNKVNFEKRIDLFNKFMSYMIEHELSFFIKEDVKFNYLDHNLLYDLILKNHNDNLGDYPNIYLELDYKSTNNKQIGNCLLFIKKTKIYKDLKKVYFKFFKPKS